MSLDVYLTMDGVKSSGGSGIFFRENGQTKEISLEEWESRFPGREPVRVIAEEGDGNGEVFSANVTHNMCDMADEAGLYKPLWRPEEVGITKAHQLIPILEAGIKLMESDPERFEKFNPDNGWGSYDVFLPWVKDYLCACKQYPEAKITVSR